MGRNAGHGNDTKNNKEWKGQKWNVGWGNDRISHTNMTVKTNSIQEAFDDALTNVKKKRK